MAGELHRSGPVMPSDGLNLGQIAFSASHTPYKSAQRRTKSRRAGADTAQAQTAPSNAAVRPMFELVAGRLDRPLQARSSVPTTLFSSVAHGVAFAGVFLLISMSERIALPNPQDTTYLVALVAATPPPPPPPAAASAASPAAAAAAPARQEPPQMFTAPPPDIALALAELPEEIPPEQYFAPLSLSVGLGNGVGSEGSGSGFGVEGGVGWGQGMSSPGQEPIRVGGAVTTPELVHRVEPAYPPDAVADRVEGTVVVEATVDEQGRVEAVRVLRSIGPLDQAAIDAVMQWRYVPLRVNDQSARFILTVNVSFRLH